MMIELIFLLCFAGECQTILGGYYSTSHIERCFSTGSAIVQSINGDPDLPAVSSFECRMVSGSNIA